MRRKPFSFLLVIGLVLCYPAALVAIEETVTVDCTDPDPKKQQSINKALASKAEQLTIEISGFCQERVVITRDNVTLIGSDPATDGVTGPALEDPFVQRALVQIFDGRGVRLENLGITGSESRGFEVNGSLANVEVVNCRVFGNDFRGFQVNEGFAAVEDTVVEENGAPEMLTFGGGLINCTRCTVQDDNGIAVLPVRLGVITLTDSTVSTGGNVAVFTVERATVFATNTDVSAASIALYAEQSGEIFWTGGQVEGSIWADQHSQVYLTGVAQTANPAGNFATDDSHVKIEGGTFLGDLLLSGFSDGTAEGSPIFDTVSCDRGGDFYCDGSETKTSSSCGLCP